MTQHQAGWRRIVIAAALLCGSFPTTQILDGAPARTKTALPSRQPAAAKLLDLPLVFEPNLGQTDPQVRFLTRAAGMTAFLTDRENVMVLSRHESGQREAPEIERAVVRMKLEDARLPLRFEGLEKATSVSNYFIGNDPSKWRPNVPHYRKLRAHGVYRGIDLVYYGDGKKLEYDFVVEPGADPSRIRLAYEGAESLATDAKGNLLITTTLGTLIQRKPVVYQEINGERREVEASYSITAGKVEFALANWDRRRELVIDPVLEYSTYLGGSAAGDEEGRGIAVDTGGAAYVVGYTGSTDFPITSGALYPNHSGNFDIFVTKLSATGTALEFSTFLGGSGNDYGNGVVLGVDGTIYLAGYTNSTDFPFTTGAVRTSLVGDTDTFVTRISAAGNALILSTYLGGTGSDVGYSLAVDADGASYVAGYTSSTDFPVTPGAYQTTNAGGSPQPTDLFVAKLNAAGTALLYATYLGGSGSDWHYGGIKVANGAAYLTGWTYSSNFPTTTGAFQTTFGGGTSDAVVVKLNTTGTALEYSTHLGGSGLDRGYDIVVDSNGAAYVTGITWSDNFPSTASAFQPSFGGVTDVFVTKLNATGSALVYSTYLGGSDGGEEYGYGIAIDTSGSAYVTGFTTATDYPTTACAYQRTLDGLGDIILTKLTATGSALEFSTLLGGSSLDSAQAIALGASGPVYLTGRTWSNDFPTTTGAFQTTIATTAAAFVTKLSLPSTEPPVSIAVSSGSPQSTTVGTDFATDLQVKVTDASGDPVPNVIVTFTAPSSGASADLSSSTATTDCDGLATVRATANSATGTYDVLASVSVIASPAKLTLTNTGGDVQIIHFVEHPRDAAAGDDIGPVVVFLGDAYNNPVSGIEISLILQNGDATLNGELSQRTDEGGLAFFGGLSVNTVGIYNLKAIAEGGGNQLAVPSDQFQITAGSAVTITVSGGSGQTAAVGTAYPAQLEVLVQDAFNNPVSGASVTFTPPASGASVTFAGSTTVTTNANGIAIAPVMTANSQTGAFQVTATTTGASTSAVFSLTNVVGAANKLAFVQQPTNAVAGAAISPAVTVQLQDSFGNPVRTAGITITLQLAPHQTLFGTVSQPTNANGLATFADLSVQRVGQYQLLAEAASIVSAESAAFTIRAGTAATIQATGGTPQSATILTAFAQPLQVTVNDAYANPVQFAEVTFVPPGTNATATLTRVMTTTDANGRADTTATANGVAGSYVVTATTPGASGSASFALTNVVGAVGQIQFVQQPADTAAGATITPAVTVRVLDGAGNPVPNTEVTIQLPNGAAALNGTLTVVTDSTGLATFNDLNITVAGVYQLLAVSGTISGLSNQFRISPGQSSVLISVFAGDGQSADAGTAYSAPLRALVQDPYGNLISGASVTFTAPASGPSVTFAGSTTVLTDSSGIATSPAMTANSQTGAFQVSATITGAPSPALFNLTNLAATASHLAFIQQPSDALAGAVITPPVRVQLQDANGNPVTTPGVAVSLQSNAVARRLRLVSGTTTQNTDANGVATFADLSIAQPGTYQLQATAPAVASATSQPFNVRAGIPASIVASGGTPQSALILTVFGVPLQVTVTDASGNPVSGVEVVFAAPTSGASGLFGGQATVTANTDAEGHASAVITANNIAGSYTVTASSSLITGSATFALMNLPAGALSLVFVQQPTNTVAGQTITPPVTVRVQNASGQPVSVAGLPVVLALSSGTGTLLGTLVQLTNDAGLATFNDLRIAEVGTKRLRATATQEIPAESNPFQITGGAAATLTAIGGTPQSTAVSRPFPSRLQAQVKDSAGNPVSGVAVTFAAPPSGPSGVFSGLATIATGSNGIATAPQLTANNQAGSFAVTATATGVASPAVFSLTNLPQPISPALVVEPATVAFVSEINQPAPAGQIVQIDQPGAAVTWTASSSASWLTVTPTSGTTPGQLTLRVNPAGLSAGTYTGTIRITASTGAEAVISVTYTITDRPALVIRPPTLVFSTSSNTITPAAKTLTATSTSRNIAYRVSTQVSTPAGGAWLQVSPAQGQTTGTVTVNANPAGLSQGVYDGSVLFTPVDSGLNSVAVPVTLIVDCSQGGCQTQPTILSVVNSASFQPGGAPHAIMTIFGTNLSDAIYQATSFPLPTRLGSTTVSVNGSVAPLYYVSPTQINFQLPVNVGAAVSVVVNNQATFGTRALRASAGHNSTLASVDPGLYLTTGGRAAALNEDLTPHTAATPIAAGRHVVLFLTGQGPVTPVVIEGQAAPASPLSRMDGTAQVRIGDRSAVVTYQGLAPGFAGLAQINAIVPAGLTPGNQPVFVTINGVPSNAGVITVQ